MEHFPTYHIPQWNESKNISFQFILGGVCKPAECPPIQKTAFGFGRSIVENVISSCRTRSAPDSRQRCWSPDTDRLSIHLLVNKSGRKSLSPCYQVSCHYSSITISRSQIFAVPKLNWNSIDFSIVKCMSVNWFQWTEVATVSSVLHAMGRVCV
jgi:hypothetical protein